MGHMSTCSTARVTAVLLAGVLVFSSCSDDSDAGAPSNTATATTIVAEVTTPQPTTTRVTDESERRQAVSDFLDAVESNENCTSFECKTAEAAYRRYENLYELVGEIPGDDVSQFATAISSAWDAWNACLASAETRFDRFDCAAESGMEQAITDLSDALR